MLPAFKAYSIAIASGRDAAGLWEHGMATLDLNRGQRNGRLPGYAVMNQSSLPCFLSLLLADKAGLKHPEIQAGIAQTHRFYTDFIGRGTLPYGVHDPNPWAFNNNGMSGLAAVAFALHDNQEGAMPPTRATETCCSSSPTTNRTTRAAALTNKSAPPCLPFARIPTRPAW